MANKENLVPPSVDATKLHINEPSPPLSQGSIVLGLRQWPNSAYKCPPFQAISPNSKPALCRQRDHSACRRPDTPLMVKKTRENLRDVGFYPDIPPPCLHGSGNNQTQPTEPEHFDSFREISASKDIIESARLASSKGDAQVTSLPSQTTPGSAMPPPASVGLQRQKSAGRRMLSKVKHGVSGRAKDSNETSTPPAESQMSLLRRLSHRRKQSADSGRRAQSFEMSSTCVESTEGEYAREVSSSSRSFTDSTMSTSDVLSDPQLSRLPTPTPFAETSCSTTIVDAAASSPSRPGSPTGEPTPRRLMKTPTPVSNTLPSGPPGDVPYIALRVTTDCTTLDVRAEKDLWVAIEATVCTQENRHPSKTSHAAAGSSDATCGAITSLRLCFKPTDACQVLDIAGQKTLKDLRVDQICSLFIKLHIQPVHSLNTASLDGKDPEAHDCLFDELESIVGTLETQILQVEARYRHSMLPRDNVVTVRQNLSIRRPRMESRWSIIDAYGEEEEKAGELCASVPSKLARHLAKHYPAERALRLIDRHLADLLPHECDVQHTRQGVLDSILNASNRASGTAADATADQPSVIITEYELDTVGNVSETVTTGRCTPSSTNPHLPTSTVTAHTSRPARPCSTSLTTLPSLTTAKTNHDEDDARKVWRHIRRSSLTAKQLAEASSPERLQQLEAEDGTVGALRRKALANKRSVGAETLYAWKWEGERQGQLHASGEAPWL